MGHQASMCVWLLYGCPLGLHWELLPLDVEGCHGHQDCEAFQNRELIKPVCHFAYGLKDCKAKGCSAVKAFGEMSQDECPRTTT